MIGKASSPSEGGSPHTTQQEGVGVFNATFVRLDLIMLFRLDELELKSHRSGVKPEGALLVWEVVKPDSWCLRCGARGARRDLVTRRLAH